MTRQALFNQVTEAIKNGEYKCIHYIERDGKNNIVITLASDLMCFVNEDGTANILCKGNANMLQIGRMALIDLSVEGAAMAEERRRQEEEKARMQAILDMKDKLPRWKEQQAILQAKIEEAERVTSNEETKRQLEQMLHPAERPVEYPTNPEEAAAPLPSPAETCKNWDEIKVHAQETFRKTLEREFALDSDPWYKRLMRRKD